MLEGSALVESVDTTLLMMELSAMTTVVVVTIVVPSAMSVAALDSTGREMAVEAEAMLMRNKPKSA